MIFPHQIAAHLPLARVHGLLVEAYDRHAEVHREVLARFGEGWLLVAGAWEVFASAWCAGMPVLVGHVTSAGGIVLYGDRRLWEPMPPCDGWGEAGGEGAACEYLYRHELSERRQPRLGGRHGGRGWMGVPAGGAAAIRCWRCG